MLKEGPRTWLYLSTIMHAGLCTLYMQTDGSLAVYYKATPEEEAYLVVLGHDHVGILGEVEVEGGLVSAQVVHMEDEALVHTGPVAPDDPSHPRVHQPIPGMRNPC